MNNNDSKGAPLHTGQQGSGSAENKGNDRQEQQNKTTNLSNADQENIARELGRDSSRLANLRDMGSLSGRDDYAGGSGDRMNEENTNEATDR